MPGRGDVSELIGWLGVAIGIIGGAIGTAVGISRASVGNRRRVIRLAITLWLVVVALTVAGALLSRPYFVAAIVAYSALLTALIWTNKAVEA